MTREDFLQDLMRSYEQISVLSDRNGGCVLWLRHRNTGKDLVFRSFPRAVEAYKRLLGIRCRNLPEIYETLVLEDGQVVLEEFIAGITVAQRMETGRYTRAAARNVVKSVCQALTVLHERKIIHRDVKPENVLCTDDGRVVLIDFNIARIENTADRDTQLLGSVGYAAPEQLGMAQSDARSDIFATGVLLNVLLTGEHPCNVLAKGRYRRIIQKCISTNPKGRYPSAKKLHGAL